MNRLVASTALISCSLLLASSAQAVEPAERIYWANFLGSIQSSLPTGANRSFFQGLDTQFPAPWDIAIDSASKEIYWSDVSDSAIRRANLDGSGVEIVYQGSSNNEPLGISLDPLNDKLYWVADGSNDVVRSNLDGSNIEVLFDGTFSSDLRRITVDPVRKRIYWTDVRENVIFSSSLDGSSRVPLIDLGLMDPESVALDLVQQKLYWTTIGFDQIQRSDLDGSSIETVVSQVSSDIVKPIGLTVDPVAEKMYWIEIDPMRIRRANLDGSMIETIITAGVGFSRNLALDQAFVPEPSSCVLFLVGIGLPSYRKK